MSFVVPPPAPPSVAIVGRTERFPVHRIYCVGRNYAAHAREMGKDPTREAPFFFTKPADAIVASGTQLCYPSRTTDLIFTGTPAGVAAIKSKDRLEGGIDGLETLQLTVI